METKLPEMVPLGEASSNLAEIGYDGAGEKLYVRFRSGGLYCYSAVSATLFEDFLNSKSKGRFLHNLIKPNCPAEKLT
jgi:hypothetical protein